MNESFEVQTTRSYIIVGLIFYILGALGFILLILIIRLFPLIDSFKNI